jgi:starch synthase
MTDVIQDGVNGLLVASGDRAGLARAIDRVLADPGLARRMGEAGRRMALAQYGYQRMVEEVERLYGRLLEMRQPVRMSA